MHARMIRSNVVQPLNHAVSGALAGLLRDAPLSPGKVAFAWHAAVGTSLDRVTAVRLEGGVLLVDAQDVNWAREVTRSADIILLRIQALLGAGTVERLVVREPPDAKPAPRRRRH